MKKPKKIQETKPDSPYVHIEHSTFDGSLGDRLPAVTALAGAIAANAKAIEAMAKILQGPEALLHVGSKITQ